MPRIQFSLPDRFAFAMPMRHDGDRLVIQPETMSASPRSSPVSAGRPGAG